MQRLWPPRWQAKDENPPERDGSRFQKVYLVSAFSVCGIAIERECRALSTLAMNQSTMQPLAPLPAWPRRRRRRLQRTSRAAKRATLHPSARCTRGGLVRGGAPIHEPRRSHLQFCRNRYVEGSGSLSTAETRSRFRESPTATTTRRPRRTAAETPGVGRRSALCCDRRAVFSTSAARRGTCHHRARLRDPFVSDNGR